MLSEAIPEEEVRSVFPSARTVIVAESVDEWRRLKEEQVPGTLMYIWDRMVHRGETDTPWKISSIVDNEFKGLYDFVATELGSAPVLEALAVDFFNDVSADTPFASISLARIHGKELHIADIELSDNRYPVASASREFRGLHVFGDVLTRLKSVARKNGDTQLSLVAASHPAHQTFARHGFQVGPTSLDQAGFAARGEGHGMVLRTASA